MKNKIICIVTLIFTILSTGVDARIRSQAAKDAFKLAHPCPTNGNNHGPCPGYVIDHINPLACGGADAPANMQWQSIAEGKAKDKIERKNCQTAGEKTFRPKSISNPSYYIGPRGGCYTLTASGDKHYVDRSLCRN